MITSFIKKYILPKEVEFIGGLIKQSEMIQEIMNALQECFIEQNENQCQAILQNEHKAQKIRESNMNELLNAFLTPIDRESLYRVITQMDWIALSIRHFVLEAKAYEIKQLDDGYIDILRALQQASRTLHFGFQHLAKPNNHDIDNATQEIRDLYDFIVDIYIQKMASLSRNESFAKKELLKQLKEIAKRFRVCADGLEDIVIKMA
ncbi:MAG: DUF47 family protein [Campylobacterales bacterium]|nr:DUF47 family protein [Campylobacterales bacterium]